MFFFFKPQYLLMQDPAWKTLTQALDYIKKRYPKMTVGTLSTFIELTRLQSDIYEERITLSDIAKRMDVSYPTLTRQTDLLAEGVGGRDGLNLMEKVNIPGSQKNKIVDLTPGGMKIICDLHEILTEKSG